jgi:hypothetical protein
MDRAPARQLLHKVEGRLRLAVNGRFQPTIKTNANQTEMWVLSNVSDFAYMNLQLTETATGYHPKIAIVKEDGNPFSAVHYPVTDDGTRLRIPPASRAAVAITMPRKGDLILELPSRGRASCLITLIWGTAPGVSL